MNETFDLLVLGLGNPLCGDDGAGVAAVSRLRDRYDSPRGVIVLDGGTLGLALLPYLRQARTVILVDAIAADAAAGTLVRLDGEDVAPAAAHRLSPHQVGVADLLDGARLLGGYPEEIVLVGIVPAQLALSVARTAEVEARIDDLVQATIDEAARIGHAFVPRERSQADGDDLLRSGPHARLLGL